MYVHAYCVCEYTRVLVAGSRYIVSGWPWLSPACVVPLSMTVICDALTRDKSAVSQISQKSYKIGGGLDTPKLLHHGLHCYGFNGIIRKCGVDY